FRHRPALLDSHARLLYRAYSLSLLELLVNGTGGHSRLMRYIDNLSHASNDPFADLIAQFPLPGDDVKKTWHSALARPSGAQNYQFLTFAESEQRLDELLRVKIPDAGNSSKQVELSELAQRKLSAVEKMALSRVSENLVLLTIRANPVMRPIVREYQQIAALLVRGKRKRVAQLIERVYAKRKTLGGCLCDR